MIGFLAYFEPGDEAAHAGLFQVFCAEGLQGGPVGHPLVDDARRLVQRMGGAALDDARVGALGAAWARALAESEGRDADARLSRMMAGFIQGLGPDRGSRAWSVRELVAGAFRHLATMGHADPRPIVDRAVQRLLDALARCDACDDGPEFQLLLLAPPRHLLAPTDLRARLAPPDELRLQMRACGDLAASWNLGPQAGPAHLAALALEKTGCAPGSLLPDAGFLLHLEACAEAGPAELDAALHRACRVAVRARRDASWAWHLLGQAAQRWSPHQQAVAGAALARAWAATHGGLARTEGPPAGLPAALYRGWALAWSPSVVLEDAGLPSAARSVLFDALLQLPSLWLNSFCGPTQQATLRLRTLLTAGVPPAMRRSALSSLFRHGAPHLQLPAWTQARVALLKELEAGRDARELLPTLLPMYQELPRAFVGPVPLTGDRVRDFLVGEFAAIRKWMPAGDPLLQRVAGWFHEIERQVRAQEPARHDPPAAR